MFSFSVIASELFLLFLVTGLIFILAGWILRKFPPKNRNYLVGYRTASSMKSQERWDFAQAYSARAMARLGMVLVLLALASLFVKIPDRFSTVPWGIGLSLVLVLIMIWRIEVAIWKKFPDS